jgi:putative Holliday junction resolvase
MPVLDLLDLKSALQPSAPVVGLDLGEKTIGVAVSDRSLMVASPLSVIARVKFTKDLDTLLRLMASRGAEGMIIGLPINMDGTEGPRCQSARAFARRLLSLQDRPIAFWDERLSTAAVNRVLIDEANSSRARRAQVVDSLAAAWILQGALDRLRSRA